MATNFLFVVLTLVLATTIGINGNLPINGFRLSVSVLYEPGLINRVGSNTTGILEAMFEEINSLMYQDNLKIQVTVKTLRLFSNGLQNDRPALDDYLFANLMDSSIPETNLYLVLVGSGNYFILRSSGFNVCRSNRNARYFSVRWRGYHDTMKWIIHYIGLGIGLKRDYNSAEGVAKISNTGVSCDVGNNFMEDNTEGTGWSQCSVETMETLYATNKLHCIEALNTLPTTTEMDLTGEVQLIPAAQVNMSPVLAVHLSKSKYFSIFLSEVDGHKITEYNDTCAGRLCAYEAVTNIQNTSSYAMMLCDLKDNLTSLQTQLGGTKIYLFDEDATIFNVTTIIKG